MTTSFSIAPITSCCTPSACRTTTSANPWTTLNQRRIVGYLSVYDRALVTLLYDPRITPGMTPPNARAVLPQVIRDLGLAESGQKP